MQVVISWCVRRTLQILQHLNNRLPGIYQRFPQLVLAGFLLVPAYPALADMQGEIQHLLQYVEDTACEFERNGTVYDSKQARAHIERKHDYVNSRIEETEDFIRYAATGSSISGKHYHVTCNGIRQTSAEWLNDELSRYRKIHSGTATQH